MEADDRHGNSDTPGSSDPTHAGGTPVVTIADGAWEAGMTAVHHPYEDMYTIYCSYGNRAHGGGGGGSGDGGDGGGNGGGGGGGGGIGRGGGDDGGGGGDGGGGRGSNEEEGAGGGGGSQPGPGPGHPVPSGMAEVMNAGEVGFRAPPPSPFPPDHPGVPVVLTNGVPLQ
jgi:hypothetical protein